MIVNLVGKRFNEKIHGDRIWHPMYKYVIEACLDLGATIHTDIIGFSEFPPLNTNPHSYNIYNHLTKDELDSWSINNLILKPTGPTPRHFSIDTWGYGPTSSITYIEPPYKGTYTDIFYSTTVCALQKLKTNKWDRFDVELDIEIPDNHVLVIGQMPHDSVVTTMSFGNHWDKLRYIMGVLLKSEYPIVLKLHPNLFDKFISEQQKVYYEGLVKLWEELGALVIIDKINLHDILPKTKVAIIENSTCGLECLMYDVPIISYGYPEYHWVTQDLRHLTRLMDYVNTTDVWYDKERARQWFTWYYTKYLCSDYTSTRGRLAEWINAAPC